MGPEPDPLPEEKPFRKDVPLAPLTTLGLGGPADWFIEASGEAELRGALSAARERGLPVTLLGGGSNVLVSDGGVRGLVVRVRGGSARQVDGGTVRAFAGMTVNGLVRWCIQRGLAGLETWAGTPGTVGGAIHGNAHFGGREMGELVTGLSVADDAGRVENVRADAVEFGPGASPSPGGDASCSRPTSGCSRKIRRSCAGGPGRPSRSGNGPSRSPCPAPAAPSGTPIPREPPCRPAFPAPPAPCSTGPG